MVGAAAERDEGVAEKRIAAQLGMCLDLGKEPLAHPGQQIGSEAGERVWRALQQEGTAALSLVLAHHVQVESGDHAGNVRFVGR